jgi:hypothetical protein
MSTPANAQLFHYNEGAFINGIRTARTIGDRPRVIFESRMLGAEWLPGAERRSLSIVVAEWAWYLTRFGGRIILHNRCHLDAGWL